MKHSITALVAAVVFSVAVSVLADCSKDADCEEGQVCGDGKCRSEEGEAESSSADEKTSATKEAVVSEEGSDDDGAAEAADAEDTSEADDDAEGGEVKAAASVSLAAPPVPEPEEGEESDGDASTPSGNGEGTGLALGGGVGGLVVAGGVIGFHTILGMNLAADEMNDKDAEFLRYAMWGASLGTFAIAAPLVFAAGKNVRNKNPGVKGTGYLPVIGWIGYVLYLELGLVTIGLSETDVIQRKADDTGIAEHKSAIFVGTMSGFAVMSLVAFSIEALVVRNEALAAGTTAGLERPAVAWSPSILPVGDLGRPTGATFGISGSF